MKRLHETFKFLNTNQQVVYDTHAVGVGQIGEDGGRHILTNHPAYPGRPCFYHEMKTMGREPSYDLSDPNKGNSLNHSLNFRVVKGSNLYIIDALIRIAPGNGDRIRFGHDGNRWYCYVCAPLQGITPTKEFSLVKPLDNDWHLFEFAVKYNKIVGYLDSKENAFTIPYTTPKFATPDASTWTVSLYSNENNKVVFQDVDFGIVNF